MEQKRQGTEPMDTYKVSERTTAAIDLLKEMDSLTESIKAYIEIYCPEDDQLEIMQEAEYPMRKELQYLLSRSIDENLKQQPEQDII